MRARFVLFEAVSAVLGLGLLVAGASTARADSILYQLGLGNVAIAGYTGPYADVLVDRTSATTAVITFTSNTVGDYTYLLGDGGAADVNVNAATWTVGSFVATNGGTGFTPGPLTDDGSGNVDSFGVFNQKLKDFDGYSHSADFIQFTITNTSGAWATAADVLAPNASGYVAAAHIFVCDSSGGDCDAGDGALATGFATVPEASTLGLLLIGGSILAARRPRAA